MTILERGSLIVHFKVVETIWSDENTYRFYTLTCVKGTIVREKVFMMCKNVEQHLALDSVFPSST